MALIACKECQSKVSNTADKCPQCGAAVPKGFGIGAILKWSLVAFSGYLAYSCATAFDAAETGSTAGTAEPSPPAALVAAPALQLVSWRCEKVRKYARVKGEVKNISGQPLKNILAVGTLRTKSGELIDSQDTLLDLRTLLPNQTSAFDVMIDDNPLGATCEVDFKTFSGESVSYK